MGSGQRKSLAPFLAAAPPRALLLLRPLQRDTSPASTAPRLPRTPNANHRGGVKSMTHPQAARVHTDTTLSCTQL